MKEAQKQVSFLTDLEETMVEVIQLRDDFLTERHRIAATRYRGN